MIESTYHHPYWVVDGNELQSRPAPDHIASIEQTATGPGRWVDAGDLKPSDLLLLHNGTHAFVESIKFEFRTETTYNFEVDGHHNYAVGDTRILVHNNSGWRNARTKQNGLFTEPQLPPKTIVDERGVTIVHYTRSGDHGPAHLHVKGGGPETKIGQNGRPIEGSKAPTPAQQRVIDANKSQIRRSVNKIMKWWKFENII